MKITRIGPSFPLLTAATLGGDGGSVTPSVGSGLVPVSTGSNAWAWGSNVSRITSNGSNILQGPFVNFASGTGVTFAAASNTLTISTGASLTSSLGWFNVEDYGAVHNGVTDDTASIQAAIDACFAAGGGTIYFPEGVYLIAGALQSTATYNSQLKIPYNPTTNPGPVPIRFLGASALNAISDELAGAVLKSNWSGAISGTPAIFAAGLHDANLSAGNLNWVFVSFEQIKILAPANPKLTAIDMTAGASLRWNQLTVGAYNTTAPTNTNAVGVDMPWGSNSQPADGGDGLYVDGFYIGLRPSEQCASGQASFSRCAQAIQFRGQQGAPAYFRHGSQFDKVEVFLCLRSLVFTGDLRWVTIDMLVVQHDAAPFATVYDIDDASNYGRGFIGWHTTDNSTGPDDNLLMNGGTGLSLHGFHAKRWKLTNVVDVPTGTDPATNPTNGFRMYAASATGKPTTRSSAGTVTTIMREGDTAGGDLGGTYPNPTVTDDSHSHTAATVPSGGGHGAVLLESGHAVPFTFDEIIQASDGSDILYASA